MPQKYSNKSNKKNKTKKQTDGASSARASSTRALSRNKEALPKIKIKFGTRIWNEIFKSKFFQTKIPEEFYEISNEIKVRYGDLSKADPTNYVNFGDETESQMIQRINNGRREMKLIKNEIKALEEKLKDIESKKRIKDKEMKEKIKRDKVDLVFRRLRVNIVNKKLRSLKSNNSLDENEVVVYQFSEAITKKYKTELFPPHEHTQALKDNQRNNTSKRKPKTDLDDLIKNIMNSQKKQNTSRRVSSRLTLRRRTRRASI